MGQFGSLWDQMNWSARNHNIFAAVNYEFNAKWSVYGNYVFNRGRGSYYGIELNAATLPAVPAGFNYAAISDMGRFSALNADRTQAVMGTSYKFAPNWVFNGSYFYGRFKDNSPYLLDATGRAQGVEAGISYVF